MNPSHIVYFFATCNILAGIAYGIKGNWWACGAWVFIGLANFCFGKGMG